MTGAVEREVLERRARDLARPAVKLTGETIELVTFALAGETYGIESRFVLSIQRLVELARIPAAETPLYGISTWRGTLLSILDLRPILGIATAEVDDLCRILVLGERDGSPFGILVDRVHDVVSVARSAVAQPPAGVVAKRDLIEGMTSDAVIVLAADRILARNS